MDDHRMTHTWVESMGGPLIVVPVSALAAWHGCTHTGAIAGNATAVDDYDRACEVDDLAGVIAVGDKGAQALVLADEPATTRYVPEHNLFLRRLAADNEAELAATAQAALMDRTTPWEEYGTWTTDGPAVLMDSAEAGSDLNQEYPDGGTPSYAPLPLPPGTWRVRAAHTEAQDGTQAGLVQLVPTDAHPRRPPHA
ncbi:immunity protein 21 of polymorphic toxin system [Streptomyces sp. T12]|uniref:immunity 21 family protein n=1 Tax=Streptomyces sp. T12 TaxID=477697 RepID=UPI0011AC0414|nr:immunity 21 family protein [Streptomyces sp. T12]TWD21655.1 immunity protein 21 of polymorphic toxin system [Streptomyces sp. T12]